VKKAILAFSIIAFCSLLLTNAVIVNAAEAGYERTDYNPDEASPITIDGEWTTADEWAMNGENTTVGDDLNFKSVWFMVGQVGDDYIVNDTWLVEFYTDTTNDVGDYFEFCVDGDQSGGAAPAATDYRILIEDNTDLTVYVGDGSGWVEDGAFDMNNINWSISISASPFNATAHWILEMVLTKGSLGMGPNWNFRLAAYDAGTDTLAAWPPTPNDEPDRWGVQSYTSGTVPEALTIGVVVLLSSAAVAVSLYSLRKRPKIAKTHTL
jgi:hypothetical protein